MEVSEAMVISAVLEVLALATLALELAWVEECPSRSDTRRSTACLWD